MAIIPARTEISCGFVRRLEQRRPASSLSPTSPECNRTILPCRIPGNNTPASPIYPTTRLRPITDSRADRDHDNVRQDKTDPSVAACSNIRSRPNDDSWSRPGAREDKMPVSPVPCCRGREGAPAPRAGALAYLTVRQHVTRGPGIEKWPDRAVRDIPRPQREKPRGRPGALRRPSIA
jgi:hypothetical protein